MVKVMKGLVVVDADLAKRAEQGLGGGNGEDDAGVERLHEDAVVDQIRLRSAGQANLVAGELGVAWRRAERHGHSSGRGSRLRDEDWSSACHRRG